MSRSRQRAEPGTFRVRLHVADPPTTVWGRLTSLDHHSRRIPFTRVRPDGARMRPGLAFEGITRLGPLRITDRMVVQRADAPAAGEAGRLTVRKFGVFAGTVEAVVAADGTGTLVEWRQVLAPRWLAPLLRPPAALVARASYGMGLRRLLR